MHFESVCDELFRNRVVSVYTASDHNGISPHCVSVFADAIRNIALRDRHEFCTGDERDAMVACLVYGTSPSGVGNFETKLLARFKDSDTAAAFGKRIPFFFFFVFIIIFLFFVLISIVFFFFCEFMYFVFALFNMDSPLL